MQSTNSTYRSSIEAFAEPSRLPDFFLLGAPKCGTTSVFHWLQTHPDTYLPLKEANFLSRDVWDDSGEPGAICDWADYLNRLCPPGSGGRLTGDCSPRALYSDLALEALATREDAPRLLILLRNPIDLVFSLHGQMVKEGVERELSFLRAWRRSLILPARGEGRRADRRLDYPMFGRFGARLERVFARFGPARVKVMILEEALTRDRAAAFAEIATFLGLRPLRRDLPIHNRRTAYRSARLQAAMNRGRGAAMRGLAGLGLRPSRGTGLLRFATQLNTRSAKAPVLSAEMRDELTAFFASDVAKTEQLLGRPVSAWSDFHAG